MDLLGGGHDLSDVRCLPPASRQGSSATGSMRRCSGAAAWDPREMSAVGKISAMWQKVQPI
jgi:hypothetical protein